MSLFDQHNMWSWRPLLWCVLCFAALQLALGLWVEGWLPDVRDPEFAEHAGLLAAQIRENPGRPLFLMLGSSRTAVGLQAGALPGNPPILVYNFGMKGAGPIEHLVVLRRLLALGIKPAHLLVEVLPSFYNQPGPYSLEDDWVNGGRLTFSEIGQLRPYHGNPGRLIRRWCKDRCWALFRGRQSLQKHFQLLPRQSDLAAADAHGYQGFDPPDDCEAKRRERIALNLKQYSSTVGPFHLAPGVARALTDLLDLCRDKRIEVTLVLMPETTYFQALYCPFRAGFDQFLEAVCSQLHVPLVDARNWIADEAFWDAHHLRLSGATQFTERLYKEAIQPILHPDTKRSLPAVQSVSHQAENLE